MQSVFSGDTLLTIMNHRFGKVVVIALGGSVIFPNNIDSDFLRRFRLFIRDQVSRYQRKFLIVAGGGKICRAYQQAASEVIQLPSEDQDWLGIHTTRGNAQLLRSVFRDIANPVVIDERYKVRTLRYPVTIASGWRPGNSTDYIAFALAEDFGVDEVVVAGKPKYVYTKDPRKYKSAKPLTLISWKEYRKLIPRKWVPGAHAPVDSVAARLGQEEGISAFVIGGTDLKNFQDMLNGKEFRGTMIG